VIDSSVARHLVRAVQAAELLGCRSVMVGIGPDIARTLVGLDIDFGRITTQGTLQSGLAYALSRLSAARAAGR
jgi:rsbT co-antagonist protein RsbR